MLPFETGLSYSVSHVINGSCDLLWKKQLFVVVDLLSLFKNK